MGIHYPIGDIGYIEVNLEVDMSWIRPIISLIAVGGITAGFFLRLINPETYVALMAVTVTWWFKSRDETKKL